MEKKYKLIDETGNKNPFKAPEGYFEELNKRIIDRLDEVPVEKPAEIKTWDRIKPWVYMAAMFVGIALMFKLFKGDLTQSDKYADSQMKKVEQQMSQLDFLEGESYEDVYDYFESQALSHQYREAVFLGN